MKLSGGILVLSLVLFQACSQKSKKSEADKLPPACSNSVCKLKVEGYPQEVAILIPPYANYKNVTLFLQDFSTGKQRDQNLTAVLNDFEIVNAFKNSPTNRVLFVPFGSGQNKEYKTYFKNKLELQAFFLQAYKTLGMDVMVEDIQIIAHGKSYKIVENVLLGRLKENVNIKVSQITLLDGTYPEMKTKVFSQWLKSSGDNRMTAIYLKNSVTEKAALRLWSQFSGEEFGREGGINLEDGNFLTLIPEGEFKKSDAHWLLARKWLARSL